MKMFSLLSKYTSREKKNIRFWMDGGRIQYHSCSFKKKKKKRKRKRKKMQKLYMHEGWRIDKREGISKLLHCTFEHQQRSINKSENNRSMTHVIPALLH